MSLKLTLNRESDFTGEYEPSSKTGGLWRMNDSAPDSNNYIEDSSGYGRKGEIVNWSGTTASLRAGHFGNYLRFNINSPTTEQTHLRVYNKDGSFFSDMGSRIAAGGWIYPTTWSVGSTYVPLFNTRCGDGQPLFYISLYLGRLRNMLYNSSGTLIYDQTEASPMPLTLVNGGAYFVATIIDIENQTVQSFVGDRDSGEYFSTSLYSYTGTLNPSCTADIVLGMHDNSYYFAGGMDDWFFETDTDLTIEDLREYFLSALCANGGDSESAVDAISSPGSVTLRASNGAYPASGTLYTKAVACGISGTGRVQVSAEYESGVTAVTDIQTSTSDDLLEWSEWADIGGDGKLVSPARKYIRFRVTLTTNNTTKTPKVTAIRVYDIPKAPYQKIGLSYPVVLDEDGAWEAVLENAYDIIVASEINGEDSLTFSIPFSDAKRKYLDNEKSVQIVDDIYIIRTVTDTRDTDGTIKTEVYAEAEFYDLTYSVRKEEKDFDAATAEEAMEYALADTAWSVGTVEPTTLRTWTCSETNALSILRKVADLHGGDLVFDCPNHLVHLYSVYGSDNGVLFAYGKNMKSIQRVVDTTGLVTRLYATGADGMTFADINNGRAYVEDFTYSSDIRISALDCSSFTNPYQMLEYAKMRLADYCQPTVSYVLNAMDLSVLTGYEHEEWALGDYIHVADEDLGISLTTRLVRREYNLQEPWNTVLELSTTLKNLASSASDWDNAADELSGVGIVSSTDIAELVPFNHLRNSRADDGMDCWVNSGFEADAENGASGSCSFRAQGASGVTKSMSQTVYPANRSSYVISAQIASEDLEKLSGDSQVGIEVVIEYEDGTTESRFIDLY